MTRWAAAAVVLGPAGVLMDFLAVHEVGAPQTNGLVIGSAMGALALAAGLAALVRAAAGKTGIFTALAGMLAGSVALVPAWFALALL